MCLMEKVPAQGYPDGDIVLPSGVTGVYIPENVILRKVKEIAQVIARDSSSYLHTLVILKGAVVFASDLFREIARIASIDLYHSFLKVSSYGNKAESSGKIVLSHDVHEIRGRDILVIEDIVDTGRTIERLRDYLYEERGAEHVRICCLMDKKCARLPGIDLVPDYCGFEVADHFLVGYGLDYAEKFRELPYVGILDKSAFGIE